MKNNLEFWNKVEKTNPNHTKNLTSKGRQMTAINAQQQIKNATNQFGMYGKTWGLKNVRLNYIDNLCNNQILCVAQAEFFYPDGVFDIGSSILVQSFIQSKQYNKVDDDFLKKLETDMTTKSLSKLGFNADVFLGYYDDNKYVTQLREDFKQKQKLTDKGLEYLLTQGTKDEINKALKDRELTTEQETQLKAKL